MPRGIDFIRAPERDVGISRARRGRSPPWTASCGGPSSTPSPDADGNVYAVGALAEGETGASLWSFDRELRIRWTKRGLPARRLSDVSLFRAGGLVGVWERGGKKIAFVSCVDGQTAFEYPPPSGATPVHVEKCRAMAADADGSILALVEGEGWGGAPDHSVFVRFTTAGEMLDVWPGVAAQRPEPGTPIPRLIALGTAPTCVQAAPLLRAGADGVMNLFAVGEAGMVRTATGFQRAEGRLVVRMRRDGAVNVLPPLPFGAVLGGDASSKLWVLGNGGLLRVTRGGHIEQHLARVEAGGVIGKEWVLAVEPGGAAVLLGDGGAVRRVGVDGGSSWYASDGGPIGGCRCRCRCRFRPRCAWRWRKRWRKGDHPDPRRRTIPAMSSSTQLLLSMIRGACTLAALAWKSRCWWPSSSRYDGIVRTPCPSCHVGGHAILRHPREQHRVRGPPMVARGGESIFVFQAGITAMLTLVRVASVVLLIVGLVRLAAPARTTAGLQP